MARDNDLTDIRTWTLPARYAGEDYGEIDLGDFNVHEAEAFAEATGTDLFRCVQAGRFTFEAVTALVWLCERRKSPEITLDEVKDNMRVQDMIDIAIARAEADAPPDMSKPPKGRKQQAKEKAEKEQADSLGKAGGGGTAT